MIKSPEEIEMMRRSAALVDKAMLAGYDATTVGATGDQINAAVNETLLANGGEYMGLPPFVLAGERSCLPHQTGGTNALKRDDLMYFEISASQRRYAAALMRHDLCWHSKGRVAARRTGLRRRHDRGARIHQTGRDVP